MQLVGAKGVASPSVRRNEEQTQRKRIAGRVDIVASVAEDRVDIAETV